MSSSAELNFDLSTRIMVLDAGMYIVRLLATNPAPETCVTVQQSPLGRGTVDFFPAEGVTRNTLSSPGDCIVIRVKGSQAGLLVTEIHKKGTERVSLMVDRIVTGAELVANGAKTTRVGEDAAEPEQAADAPVDAVAGSANAFAARSTAASVSATSTAFNAAATSAAATAAAALRAEPAAVAATHEAIAPVQQATAVQPSVAIEPALNAFAPVGAVQAAAAANEHAASAHSHSAGAGAGAALSITHVGHVEYKGDVSVTDTWLGNPTSTHRLEGFALTWNDMPAGVNLAYSCRAGVGAEPQIGLAGQFVGTRRQAKPITAVAFVLSGPRAHEFELSGHVAFAGLPPFAIVPGQELSGPSGAEHLVALQLVVTPKASQSVPPASPWNNAATARTFRAS